MKKKKLRHPKITKDHRGYYEQLYTTKLENHEESLQHPMTGSGGRKPEQTNHKEIETVIKNIP